MQQLTDWVGRRVTLRHRVGEREGRALFSDAVGELADGGPDAVVVHSRRGAVRVARSAVVAVRLVPPAVPRRASWAAVARLEGLCADAWPAAVDVALGAWRLRAAGGFTGRANSAIAVGDPGLPVPAALTEVRRFAVEHGIAPRLQVPIGSPWDRAAADAGWVLDSGHAAGAEVAVLVGDLAGLDDPAGPGEPVHPAQPADHARPTDHAEPAATGTGVTLLDRPDDRWWQLALGRDPSPAERAVLDPADPADPADAGDGARRSRPRTVFALVPGLAAARGALVDDHLHLSRLVTSPDARRHGHGRAATAALAAWGRRHGARWAVLQVALHNTAARAFYDRLGCREHHRYRYRVPPA
ncbi:MAG: GNAT family N-acetyltransferase [Pseudonocardia sp.]